MQNLTLEELKEKLKRLDEVTVLELLGLTSADLVEVWTDQINDNFERFAKEVEEDDC